jgi:peptidoglycan/LPS O-acetylase OafA/YrhL
VFYHYGVPGVSGGFIGVDIFFVISGYLITNLLITELNEHARIDLVRFYGRRARRLLPAALVVTASIIIAGSFLLSPPEQIPVAKAGVATSLYVSNFWFLQQTFDYFAPESALNPLLHTWSLSVEEQFYVIWPTVLMLAAKPKVGMRSR